MYLDQSTPSSEIQSEGLIEETAKAANLVENVSRNFVEITKAAGEFFKTPFSKSTLNKFFYKLKSLEEEWFTFSLKYARLARENRTLILDYEREKDRKIFYKSRLEFINSCQENIERLNALYQNVKYLAKPDTSEKYAQTDYFRIKVDSLKDAKNTLNMIKDAVDKREYVYEETNNIVQDLKDKLEGLEIENYLLIEALKKRGDGDVNSESHSEKVNKQHKKLPSTRSKRSTKSRSFESSTKHDLNKFQTRMSRQGVSSRQERTRLVKTPVIECPRKFQEVKSPRKATPFSPPPYPVLKYKNRDKFQNVPYKKKKDSRKKLLDERSHSASREALLQEENEKQLKTILSIRSMLTNTVMSKVSDPSMPTTDELARRSKGDCREIEVLKKIQKEIRLKQSAIKDKIDRFNKMMSI